MPSRDTALVIGVTGLIGAGKSTAADALKSLGAVVVDADQIGHSVVDNSASLKRDLSRAFGDEILSTTGRVRRKLLASRAFVDEDSRLRLNALVHPYLLKELRRQVAQALRRFHTVVIDAALLLDWSLDKEVDQTLVIHAGRELRWSRLAGRGISLQDARARERLQMPFREYRARADRVIMNNQTKADLLRKISAWYANISCKDR